MYGTVMIGKLKVPAEEIDRVAREWNADRKVPGFVRSEVLVGDDGTTVVNNVWFESREHYLKLADDPEQDRWWREKMAPLFDGEPQWIDGSWLSAMVAMPDQRIVTETPESARR
jgi:hypothetical protein